MTHRRRARLHAAPLPRCAKRRKPAGPSSGGFPLDDPRRSHFPRACKQGNENTRGNGGSAPTYSDAPAGALRKKRA